MEEGPKKTWLKRTVWNRKEISRIRRRVGRVIQRSVVWWLGLPKKKKKGEESFMGRTIEHHPVSSRRGVGRETRGEDEKMVSLVQRGGRKARKTGCEGTPTRVR